MRIAASSIAACVSLAVLVLGAPSEQPPNIEPSTSKAYQGDELKILCRLNRDRQSRYENPVFLHHTLSQVAQELGTKYAGGAQQSSHFNSLLSSKILPLGTSVYASYQILGTLASDDDYIQGIESSINSSLFARNLDAIGLYENSGVYTIVLASGLAQKPQNIGLCPTSRIQFTPSDNSVMPTNIVNGVDLPRFLCSINTERVNANQDSFVVHHSLENEAYEQVKVMNSIGHYTVNGPRPVDQAIYSQHVNITKLSWMAGDSYHSAASLVDLLMSGYSTTILDPAFAVIGVAQLNGYWSVILGGLTYRVWPDQTCPLSIDDITYI
ncbi:hypothetical protein GQ54DRAFT_310191 [Martensiomyces pterosporus]|nr:hypothetical protein GQ54DRAFT_310191 [Martensiomyces pterosporus]